ncbi:MAG: type II secretion system F family protein [Candidatus Aenigmarchaeota archaeon]|jgi:flagellar protein FlaJ|nr:type II secretion system F family protein [Candidatus Aenigmarchaeota archaeon]
MFSRYAFRLFGDLAKKIEPYFPFLKEELKRADLKISPQEYLANALFASLITFMLILPVVSFSISFTFGSFLFGYLTSITLTIILPIIVFIIYLNYPKRIIKNREKEIDKYLPFSSLYLSSILSSGLPLHKAIKTYTEFSQHEAIYEEIKKIVNDIEFFGLDIETALERAINRTPSRKFREFLYGILATMRSGGNIYTFVKERTTDFFIEYRRKLSEFSHSMTIYTEIYLVAVFLGTIFFIILTSVVAALGEAQNVLGLQLFMIFVFLPSISTLFLFLIKRAQPFWE